MPGTQRCSITWWIDWWVMNGWIDEWSILSSLQELMAYYREISIAGHGKSGFGVNLPTALLRCFNFILQAMRSQQRCWNSNDRLVFQEVPQGSSVESSQGKGEAGGRASREVLQWFRSWMMRFIQRQQLQNSRDREAESQYLRHPDNFLEDECAL